MSQHQRRGSGEPELIADMTRAVMSKYNVNPKYVFVAGLSAGAAESVILGATYPDIFSGAGVASGLEYAAATDILGAYTAMREGGPNPSTSANEAHNAGGSAARAIAVFVTHGTGDTVVYPGSQTNPHSTQHKPSVTDTNSNCVFFFLPCSERWSGCEAVCLL